MPKSFPSASLTSDLSLPLSCGTGNIGENNTVRILNASLLPSDLSLHSRASILCFHMLLLLPWIPWTTVFFAESSSSQCRCRVRLLPLHLMGLVPAGCQMPQIQLSVCLLKSFDTPNCFFLVFECVCYQEDP